MECGLCEQGGSINECQCADGQIKACRDWYQPVNDKEETASQVLVTLIVVMLILLVGISVVATYILWFKRRRFPFHHARLGETVEITNPMYSGEADDGPVFISDSDKQHFANPVYDSMYRGGSGGAGLSSGERDGDMTELDNLRELRGSSKMGSDEKKGLLEYNQE